MVSLFANTPIIDQVLQIVRRRLETDNVLKTYNKGNGFNLESEDTAMGSPVSHYSSEYFMEALDRRL